MTYDPTDEPWRLISQLLGEHETSLIRHHPDLRPTLVKAYLHGHDRLVKEYWAFRWFIEQHFGSDLTEALRYAAISKADTT